MLLKNRENAAPSGSLQHRLLLYLILIAVIPAFLLLFLYFGYIQVSTRRQLEQDHTHLLERTLEKLDILAQQVNEYVFWISREERILQLLSQLPERLQYSETTYEVMAGLREQFYYRPITRDVRALYILGENGLDLRCGADCSLIEPSDMKSLLQSRADGEYWGCQAEVPSRFVMNGSMIFYCHPITDPSSQKTLGQIILLFYPRLFGNELDTLLTESGSAFVLYNRSGEVLFSSANTADGSGGLTLSAVSRYAEWRLVLQVSTEALHAHFWMALLSTAALAIVVLLLVLLFAAYLSRNLAAPVEQIADQMDRIAQGDFTQSIAVKGNSEISRLGQGVNQMSASIQQLLRGQEEKQQLELRLLQNQMNPHFLYNTLSSIKLMAGLQGKNGIASAIEALGTLLRANLAGSNDLVALSDELSLLQSYVYIQNIRLKGKIEYQATADPSLLGLQVPKFILQPLVENAVLHGIGKRPEGGEVAIHACRASDTLFLSVTDDGDGIPVGRLAEIQRALQQTDSVQVLDCGKNIGLRNVQRRLRVRWGDAYGVSIASEGSGTCATLSLPVIEGK